MKKIYLFVLAALSYSLNAQLTQANHAPANGDTYDTYRCDSVNVNPGASGANATWNFGSVATYTNLVRSYTAQTVSNATYAAANIGLASSVNDMQYLASTSSSLGFYGGNIGLGSVSASLTYTLPAIFAVYPMGLNTSTSVATGGTVYVAALSTSGTFTGSSSVAVDGSGTITLPGGAVSYSNALRVITGQTVQVTTAIANATVTQISYDYYAPGIKAAVYTIYTTTAVIGGLLPSTTTQTFVSVNKAALSPPAPVGIAKHAEVDSYNVYPNPSSSVVNFSDASRNASSVLVYDLTGKLITKQSFQDGKAKLDVSSYNKGIYFYTIFDASEKALKTGKLTVSQE